MNNFQLLKENNIHIQFENRQIYGLYILHKDQCMNDDFSYFDFEPTYQRGYVWSEYDKYELLKSLFNNVPLGVIILAEKNRNNGTYYEVVDGKQRLLTLIDFFSNKISYDGIYYMNLSNKEKRYINKITISVGIMNNPTEYDILNTFVRYNTYGKRLDEKYINNAKQKIKELQLGDIR